MFFRRRSGFEEGLDKEIRFHLDRAVEEHVASGMTEEEARIRARREFGAIALAKEELRDTRRLRCVAGLAQDVRHAIRVLSRRPGVTGVAVLTLALGIWAATITFSVLDTIVLRPLPYRDADELVTIWATFPEWRNDSVLSAIADEVSPSLQDYLSWERQQSVFADVASYTTAQASWIDRENPLSIEIGYATESLFPLLGVEPFIGRLIGAGADRAAGPVAVLSYGLWQREFGGNPGAVGRVITLDRERLRERFTIAGVLPRSFSFSSTFLDEGEPPPDIWISSVYLPPSSGVEMVARLKPGLSLRQAEQETDRVFADLPFADFQALEGSETHGARLVPRHEEETEQPQGTLFVLFGSSGLLLFIACGNVANLLAGRAVERTPEVAMRAALGAGRFRICRQFLTEGLILAGAGGLLGVVGAIWTVQAIGAWIPSDFPRASQVAIDLRVLLFAAGTLSVVAVLFALVPAVSVRAAAGGAFRAGVKNRTRAQGRIQRAVVMAEIALSFVLLVGAGLLTRSLFRMTTVDPGLEATNLIAMDVVQTSRYQRPRLSPDASEQEVQQAWDEVIERQRFFREEVSQAFRSLPGIESVAAVLGGSPFGNDRSVQAYQIEGVGTDVLIDGRNVSSSYFDVLGTPLLEGHMFTESEPGEVAVVNQELADRYWHGDSPVGRQIMQADRAITVIGVVENTLDFGLSAPPTPMIYLPLEGTADGPATFMVRTGSEPAALMDSLRKAVWKIEPDMAIERIASMDELIAASHLTESRRAFLILAFALLAGALSCVGLYSVTTAFVEGRTHELGIRTALGARPVQMLWLVARQSLWLTGTGIVLGTGGALASARLLSSFLFRITPLDVPTYLTIAGALLVTTLLATYTPARRAVDADPLQALRHE